MVMVAKFSEPVHGGDNGEGLPIMLIGTLDDPKSDYNGSLVAQVGSVVATLDQLQKSMPYANIDVAAVPT